MRIRLCMNPRARYMDLCEQICMGNERACVGGRLRGKATGREGAGTGRGHPITRHISCPSRAEGKQCTSGPESEAKWGTVVPFRVRFLHFGFFSQFYASTLKTFKVVIWKSKWKRSSEDLDPRLRRQKLRRTSGKLCLVR